MPKTSFPHAVIPPPAPFPTWQGDEESPLVYLAWGERDYNRFPIPIHSNPGWTYWLLIQGEVLVETSQEKVLISSGSGLTCGPDCAFGFPRQQSPDTRVAVWIWRDAPSCLKEPDPRSLQPVHFREEQVSLLEDLHAQTRLEIFQPQPHSHAALEHLRGLMEIQFARAMDSENTSEEEILFQRARQWMLEHLADRAAMQDLAHYLGISVMRLHRLFDSAAQTSHGAYYHTL
jgi:hypothetical protein